MATMDPIDAIPLISRDVRKIKRTRGIVSKGQAGPLASPVGVPHTALQGVTVHDAFPPFPPNKKKEDQEMGGGIKEHETLGNV